MENAIAANVLGTMGAVCWSIQLIPQIIVNYRRHHTTGLQPTMMLLWATAGIPLGVYNITRNFNVALQIQPQILTILSLITWAQCKYYRDGNEDGRRWSLVKCCLVVTVIGVAMGGIEVALIFALYEVIERQLAWPGILMAVLAATLLSAGVARHYWDIWQERTVRGISFVFVGIDALGDLTSLLSLFFEPKLDVLGLVIYGSELLLWMGVFACGGWFNLRPWIKDIRRRRTNGGVLEQNQLEVDGHDVGPSLPGSDAQSIASTSSASVFRTASSSSINDRVQNGMSHHAADIRLRTAVAPV